MKKRKNQNGKKKKVFILQNAHYFHANLSLLHQLACVLITSFPLTRLALVMFQLDWLPIQGEMYYPDFYG